jgi:hypothetical protein
MCLRAGRGANDVGISKSRVVSPPYCCLCQHPARRHIPHALHLVYIWFVKLPPYQIPKGYQIPEGFHMEVGHSAHGSSRECAHSKSEIGWGSRRTRCPG